MGKTKSLAQTLGPVFGLFYVAIGIIGFFVTGFSNFTQNTNDTLLGFAINPFHNLVHLGIGLFLIILSTGFSTAVAEGAVLGVGIFYIAAFAIGVVAKDNLTILSMYGAGDLENFNHIVNGVALLTIGLISTSASEARARKTGIPAH
jgi:ABC-type transport system involved in multi-copper enzyme maturation permease subunit